MGLFDSIKDKLGIGRHHDADQRDPDATSLPGGAESTLPDQRPSATRNATTGPGQPLTPPPSGRGLDSIDVAATLDQRATSHAETLNWRTSIVDLLKTLDLDSSLGARRGLARELGYRDPDTEDTADMNLWLHREVLKRLAEHGGRVPPELHP